MDEKQKQEKFDYENGLNIVEEGGVPCFNEEIDAEDSQDDCEEDEPVVDDEDSEIYYKFVEAKKTNKDEKPLSAVVGHENQKKELLAVLDWFKRSKELKAKGISIPKGVILFGAPGNGKSLMIKEIIKYCDAPVFVFQGENYNVVKGIIETFKKAKEAGHAIIVFDELDLFIDDDNRIKRALQEGLDGVESSDDILVLSATNSLRDIPQALLRNGRLEKLIRIPDPTGEEAVELFKKHCVEFDVKLPEDFDEEDLALSFTSVSCASVKAIVNDLVLRNGTENITNEMIEDSIANITERVKDAPKQDNIEVAVHEAAHCVVAYSFKKYFTISRLAISGASGEFIANQIDEGFWPYDKVLADIKISMAGILAQKYIFGRGSRGAQDDLQNARVAAYNLFTQNGYSSCWETLPVIQGGARIETPVKRRRMERKIEKLLRKCERETLHYIKKHVPVIKALGETLYQKKHLKSKEITTILDSYGV